MSIGPPCLTIRKELKINNFIAEVEIRTGFYKFMLTITSTIFCVMNELDKAQFLVLSLLPDKNRNFGDCRET